MAYYGSLISVVQLLDEVIHRNRYPTFHLSRCQVMNSLNQRFTSFLQLLQNYSSKGDQAGDLVEERIRDVAGRARSLIEFEITHHLDTESATLAGTILDQLFARGSAPSRHGTERRPEEDLVQVELDVGSVAEEVEAIVNSQRNEESQLSVDSVGAVEQGEAATRRATMIGLEEDLNVIKNRLLDGSLHLRVIPIVGAGGIGKTTLAKHALDDDAVEYHFDYRAWVKVSQNYHKENVHQSMISALGMSRTINVPEGTEEEHIYKYLKGRRYLVVVDDIWDTQVWDDMKRIFPDDRNGSRIILTTRLLDVAKFPNGASGFFHKMKFLNDDQSWNLLQERVFANGCCPPNLVATGKLIANSCGGLPLAIVVIAGVLADVEATKYGWRKILSNAKSFLTGNDGDISNILSLSYHHLPHHLKPCFLYMGNLHDNGEISVSHLVHMLIAEGFVLSVDGSQSLEEIAEKYVENLVERNLIIVTKKRYNGQSKVCVVHDLVKDYCKQRSQKENFFIEYENAETIFLLDPIYEGSLANCIFGAAFCIVPGGADYSAFPGSAISSLFSNGALFSAVTTQSNRGLRSSKVARVFHLVDEVLRIIPPGIFRLYHLKYLTLQLNMLNLEGVSWSITKLRNLQTLVLYTTRFYSISLPSEIWEMTQLRHLIISSMSLPPVPRPGDNVCQMLEQLQTLSVVENFKFTTEAIDMIPNLRKLKIRLNATWFQSHINWHLYSLDNLSQFTLLEELKIVSGKPFLPAGSFAFPLNLKKLSLKGCGVSWEGLTVVGSLSNLQVLSLRKGSVVGDEWIPIEGEFSSLKFLLMEELDLKCWQAEQIHFPRLEHLTVMRCVRLQEIPLEVGNIPTLKVIDIYGSKLAGDSAKLILEEQKELGNEELLVRVQT